LRVLNEHDVVMPFLLLKNDNFLGGRKMKKTIVVLFAIILIFVINHAEAGTWTDLYMPGLENVSLNGISETKIVGSYKYNSDYQPYYGLLYNLVTGAYTTIDRPGVGPLGTEVRDVNGDNLVGSYYDIRWHGFIYSLSSQKWTTIDVPGTSSMQPYGIDGNNVVGYSWDGNNWNGFIYNMIAETYTSLSKPGVEHLYPTGISGGNITGRYKESGLGWRGFIYNMETQTYTTINAPGASDTIARGIDGNLIVGHYDGSRSFLYNMTDKIWTSLYDPNGSDNIFPENIGNSKIIFNIGQYGSVYTMSGDPPVVPECFAPVLGDLNGDCKVDFVDFAIMASHWLECYLQPPSACWWE